MTDKIYYHFVSASKKLRYYQKNAEKVSQRNNERQKEQRRRLAELEARSFTIADAGSFD